MSRQLPLNMNVQVRSLESDEPTMWLFELEVPTDPPTRYRLTNHDSDVNFMTDSDENPLTYSRYPMGHDGIRADVEGDLPVITFNITNASNELRQTLFDNAGFTGQPVVIRLVNYADLNDPSAQLRWDGKVIGVSVEEEVVAVAVAASNLYQRFFPRRRYQALRCRYRFGDEECGYPIDNAMAAFSDCPRTLEACDARGDDEESLIGVKRHPERFGGERGLFRGPR